MKTIEVSKEIVLPPGEGDANALFKDLQVLRDKNPNIIMAQGGVATKETSVSASLSTTLREPIRGRYYSFPEPNPVHMYLAESFDANQEAEKQHDLLIGTDDSDFQKQLEYFTKFFQKQSSATILMATSIEAFLNQIIEDDIEIEIDGVKHDKSKLEWLDIESKLKTMIPLTEKVDLVANHHLSYSRILELFKIRDRLVHLKSLSKKDQTHYSEIYRDMLKFDYQKYCQEARYLMNLLKPGFIEEEE